MPALLPLSSLPNPTPPTPPMHASFPHAHIHLPIYLFICLQSRLIPCPPSYCSSHLLTCLPLPPAASSSLDVDWEYPGALDRGGTVNDKVNFAAFCREYKAEMARRGKNYLLTMATGAGAYGYAGERAYGLGEWVGGTAGRSALAEVVVTMKQ